MGSTRLPGKIMLPLPKNSETRVIDWVINRVLSAKNIDIVIVATTVNKNDDVLVNYLENKHLQIEIFRGDEQNVLDRYYQASKKYKLDQVVRITSDCPLIDPEIVDEAITFHLKTNADYTSNSLKPSFPRGLDTEVISFNALEKAHSEASQVYELEHVTPYIYLTKPEFFQIESVEYESDVSHLRITLDTDEDYQLLSKLTKELIKNKEKINLEAILQCLNNNPDLIKINNQVKQKEIS